MAVVVVARTHGYVGSWYFQTRSGVYYVSNLASGFHAFYVAGDIYMYVYILLYLQLFQSNWKSTCGDYSVKMSFAENSAKFIVDS